MFVFLGVLDCNYFDLLEGPCLGFEYMSWSVLGDDGK